MPVNPYQKYKQQSVMTMTQGEMLVKLYDEAIKQLSGAELYLEKKDYIQVNQSLQKAQKILNYLSHTLDFKYDISDNLAALYDYFVRQIVKANTIKKAEPIREIIPMITDLKDAFAKAERLARMQ